MSTSTHNLSSTRSTTFDGHDDVDIDSLKSPPILLEGTSSTQYSHTSNTNSNSNTLEEDDDDPYRDDDNDDEEDGGSDENQVVNSIRLQYPKSSRLLLGTTTNIQQPGFLKALETRYPLELSLECFDLNPPPRLSFPKLSARASKKHIQRQQWLLRPFAIFFYKNHSGSSSGVGNDANHTWELIGRTETILYDDYHRFVTKLKVCCETSDERRKALRIELYDRKTTSDDLHDHVYIGAAQCTLDDIIGEPLLRRELKLESNKVTDAGRLIISADAIRPYGHNKPHKISFNVDVASMCKNNHRCFYVLSRQLQSGDYTAVYRSEILGKDEKKFRPSVKDLSAITAGVDEKLLRLEMFQYNGRGSHVRLGFMQSSLDKLMKTGRGGKLLWWPAAYSEDANLMDIGRVTLTEFHADDGHLHFRFRVMQ